MAKSSIKNIGIITSGGDAGGLNAVIRGAAQMALSQGIKPYVIPNGYAGLYNLIETEKLVLLDESRVSHVHSSLAGSEAGHSRVKISKIPDENRYKRVVEGLKKFGIGGLVISGGDDTGSVVVDLTNHNIPCVHAPKTMDLDLQTYSVGADSAINRISTFVEELKTTGMSHNRIMIVEVFGRYAGHTAFRGGLGADADCILIPEVPVDFDVVYEHTKRNYIARVRESDVRAGTYSIVVAEGITDAKGQHITDDSVGKDSFGHVKLSGAGKYVRKQLDDRMKADPEVKAFMKEMGMFVPGVYEIPEAREVLPGHLVRCGDTSAFDVNFGKEAGAAAVLLLMEGITGVTVASVVRGEINYIPTKDAIVQRHVDVEMLALYEELGVCFGRKPVHYTPKFRHEHRKSIRYL
jgi:6-phosphofructokinase 1